MHVIRVKEERGKVEEILEKAIDDNSPKLTKENKPCFHESEKTSSKLNKHTKNSNIKVKLLKSCQRRLRGWGHYIHRSKGKNKRKILIKMMQARKQWNEIFKVLKEGKPST